MGDLGEKKDQRKTRWKAKEHMWKTYTTLIEKQVRTSVKQKNTYGNLRNA